MQKAKIVKDKEFYLLLLTLVIPISLQNLITFFTQMLDTLMLGQLGDVAISAAALANQSFFILLMFTFGLAGGASILTAQYWGKGQIKPIRAIVTMTIRITMVVGALASIAVLVFPSAVMRIYTNDAEIIAQGVNYLKITGFSYFLFSISATFFSLIRSVEKVKITIVSNIAVLLCNGLLNYLLIFGNFGFPKMGIEGAAVATLIARIVEFIIAMSYIFVFDKRLQIKPKHFFIFDKILFRDMIQYSTPVVLNELMWVIGISTQTIIMGRLGVHVVSANTILGVIQNLATVFVFGVATASAVIIGKSIGEGDMQKVRDRGYTLKIISIFVGIFVASFIIAIKDVAINFYNVSEETKVIARELVYVFAAVGFFISVAATAIVGILRGGGDTKFALQTEVVCLWGIAVPLAFVAAFVFKLPIILVFVCMKMDEPIKTLICIIRLRGTKWIGIVTRENLKMHD